MPPSETMSNEAVTCFAVRANIWMWIHMLSFDDPRPRVPFHIFVIICILATPLGLNVRLRISGAGER